MNQITPEQQSNYLVAPSSCPVCKSDNISSVDSVDFNGNEASQQIECSDCGKTWRDVYRLVGIENVDEDGSSRVIEVAPQDAPTFCSGCGRSECLQQYEDSTRFFCQKCGWDL